MTVTTAATFAAAITAAFMAVVAAVASAASREMGHHVLDLLGRSLTVFKYSTLEVERLASQGMVQVYLYLLLAYLYNTAIETTAFLILQGNHGIIVNVLMVEMTVDAEYLAAKIEY